MKRFGFLSVLVAMAATCATARAADPYPLHNQPRPPLGTNPNPVVWGGRPSQPAASSLLPLDKKPTNRFQHGGQLHRFTHSNYAFGCYPNVSGMYNYDSYYFTNFAYPCCLPYYYVSPDDLYGPRAMLRFMGADNSVQSGLNPTLIAPPTPEADRAIAPEPQKPAERITNSQTTALAWRFIGFGDAQFVGQKFIDANSRYRKAAQIAPQVADAWFRQGFALSALGRYDQAVTAIKRGLRINPKWATSDFDLQELCGPDRLSVDVRLDELTQAVQQRPNDANLLFLMGVHLHFDGQTEKAEKAFGRAKELTGGDDDHIRVFAAK